VSRRNNRILVACVLMLCSLRAQAFVFPELPFCPLGGPPGWANRLLHADHYRYRHPYPQTRSCWQKPLPYHGSATPMILPAQRWPPAHRAPACRAKRAGGLCWRR